MDQRLNAAHVSLSWCLTRVYGERFALADCGGGSVLLDLETGAFFRLNAVAAAICGGLARDRSAAEVAAEVAERYGIPAAQAACDVEAVLAQMRQVPQASRANPIQFEADRTGFLMRCHGREVCHIDRAGEVLTQRGVGGETAEPALELRWAAPHVLVLRNHLVLHASAVHHRDGVLALCGPSGIGKTTLARCFADHGLPVVSEDLVLLAADGPAPEVILGAEPAVRGWADERAAEFEARGRVSAGDLGRAAEGERAPLRAVWFLGRSGSADPVIRCEPLAGAEALVLLLQNSFAELGRREVWRELLRANRWLVTATRCERAWCPEGLGALAAAAAAYR